MPEYALSPPTRNGGQYVPHVVMVPAPGQGHVNPFISIAHYLASSAISVTFVHSARSHSLLSSITSNPPAPAPSRLLRFEVVPDALPSDPKQSISMTDLRASIPVMRKGLEQLLEKLMQEHHPPCCLLVDNLLGWGHEVAVQFHLPRIDVWTSSASGFSLGFHIPEMVARGYIPITDKGSLEKAIDFLPGILSPFRVADLPKSVMAIDSLQSPALQFYLSVFQPAKDADRVLANTMYELESSVVEALMRESGVRMAPIGPLFLMNSFPTSPSSPASLFREDSSCISWLDKHRKSSVLYVSFGSVASLEDEVFRELAHGLEESGESFLWVIRPDNFKESVEELLPEGFMERTREKGTVISWAPQLAVLGHPSVGAFLTHCGWNSILESLSNGVPMLGFPQMAEQHSNLKLIVRDWKVGLPLVEDIAQLALLERSFVQRAVSAIMRGDEASQLRTRALELKDMALKASVGSSNSNLQTLVHDLKQCNLKLPPPSHGASSH